MKKHLSQQQESEQHKGKLSSSDRSDNKRTDQETDYFGCVLINLCDHVVSSITAAYEREFAAALKKLL